ncbi:MAG: hypothetical protein CL910_17360, partial [Deltaproteobacteria bacterium]|nr:hypothetical protein [Deltaproteobacteria bacterium]
MIARLSTWLGRPVDAGSLAIFRISVGLVMVIEVLRLVWPRSTGSDLHRWFSLEEVPVKIAYPGFEWWTGLPEPWLGLWVLVLGLASTALFLGVAARLAAGLAFLTWSGIWLLDAALYNNHFYVMSLMLLQLALMHSGRAFGLRASPGATVPFWNVALLRFQLVVIYFYAGVAKLTRRRKRVPVVAGVPALAREHLPYLRSATSNGQWPQQRLFQAGLADDAACRLC